MSNFKPIDDRQVVNRSTLQELMPWVPNQTLDVLMSSVDFDLTPPLKVDAQNPPSLTVNVGPTTVTNFESNRNKSVSFVNDILPVFAGGTVTFPPTSGGNITTSTGGSYVLTLASGFFVQILLYLDQNANVNALIGTPNHTQNLALVPNAVTNTLPFAYVTLQNVGGTIQNVVQDVIFQFVGGGGAGGGSGQINYITNPNASGTVGWNLYKNTAANIPSNGTGGSPTGLTFTSSNTAPLRGLTSFLLQQANSTNVQGEGVSTNFTIDPADQASVLGISFNYNASSTFIPGNPNIAPLNDGTTSTTAGNSDVEVFIYDILNSVLLPVTPEIIQANGSNNFSFSGFFQTATNSLNYRLILHVATANANATGWQFKFTNVIVGPEVAGIANSSLTPTKTILTASSGTYSPPSGCSYIRVKMVGGGGGGSGGSANNTFDGGSGGTGGNTTFGTSLLVANGGGGGTNVDIPGVGGTASLGSGPVGTALVGGSGGGGYELGSAVGAASGGMGAASPFGGAGGGSSYPSSNTGSSATANTGSGGGGGGAVANLLTTQGGSGGGAGGYIDALIKTLLPSYSYSIGTAGTAGTAGSNGAAGGSGASGIIIIDEFYINGSSGGISVSNKGPTIQFFASGSGTYVTPFPTPLYIEVEMVGGGGGGGSANSGGGGGTGGNTTFGTSLLVANGAAGPTGGTASIAFGSGAIGIALSGGTADGTSANFGGVNGQFSGGYGISSPFGGAGGGSGDSSGTAVNGKNAIPNTGSGGGGTSGDSSTNVSGQGGGAGGYVKAVISNPGSSYAYSVGAGGAGAVSAATGGTGGSGVIIVREYYSGVGGVTQTSFKKAPSSQIFTSGSGTYVTPFPTPLYLRVKAVGGGAGGSGSGSGAGLGSNGSNTTFGALSAGGGFASTFQSSGGLGGTSTLGIGAGIAITGGAGGSSFQDDDGSETLPGGQGGSSALGGAGGMSNILTGLSGAPNTGGGGAGGGINSPTLGASGGGGGSGGWVETLVSGPLSTYSYSVGAGGAAGGAGSGGNGAGNGGSGVIIVEEFYQ